MLSLVLSGLVALAQGAPHQPKIEPSPAPAVPLDAGLARDLATAQIFAKHVTSPKDVLANWTASGNNLCEWSGFYCTINPDTNQNALASIDFAANYSLKGNLKLAGFLDKFLDLALFHANSNGFTGDIPDLSALHYLYELDLSNNKLSGPFPRGALTANQLTFLDIRYNAFTGPIPAEVFTTFPQIEALFLNNNKFSGELPNSIGAFPGLYLSLANNKLTGSIPSTLANAASLNEVLFLGNKLTGTIPQGLGSLANLTIFDVTDNNLTGPVPEDLCASKSLTTLALKGNKLDKNLGPKCAQLKKAGVLKI